MKSRFLFNHLDAHRDYFHTYPKSKLVLRDWLALDRTAAANRRVFYSFLRTTLDLTIAGLILIHFFNYQSIIVIGAIFLLLSVVVGSFSYFRFLRVQSHYHKFLRESGSYFPPLLARKGNHS
ncbi:MAG: DUF202 domain-containing protein [Acidithiobacillus sp.]